MDANSPKHCSLEMKSKFADISPPATKQNSTPERKNVRESLKEIFNEYCSNTSLHGVKYFGQERPWKEICFWLGIFTLSFYFSSQTIRKVYQKWNDTPVIVTFSERSTPVSDIPFPAITICPEIRGRVPKDGPNFSMLLKNLTFDSEIPKNLTNRQLGEFVTLLHTCSSDVYGSEIPKLSNESYDYIQIINDMALDLEKQAVSCKWFGIEKGCTDLFTKTYTDFGLCYTFNGLKNSDLYREDTIQYGLMDLESAVDESPTKRLNRTLNWSLEEGYNKNAPIKTYPARVLSASTTASLKVTLRVLTDNIDYCCSAGTEGYKIVLHTPSVVPLPSKRFVRISARKEVSITVKPVLLTTSNGVAVYSPDKRKCFMNHERYLRFFKNYNERNCEMECLTNFTLKECGCVKFSMPRTSDMPVCAEDKIACCNEAEDKMLMEYSDDRDKDPCRCMPSCTSLHYDMEISQSDFNEQYIFSAFGWKDAETAKWSRLLVHFKDNEFIARKRSELYGYADFLANCGGILGLFMGFSILSLIEFFYHMTLRLLSNMRRKSKYVMENKSKAMKN
ncbi:pickpocket protein 28-like [Musca domestica]|uniref:Pickpocket protein 28-like n=1 Tax=Musca domestica TaxID=7370 RepID=A0ABM3VHS7_MUSDO|nr:pickpocket protein 28-like [Musca domestica]